MIKLIIKHNDQGKNIKNNNNNNTITNIATTNNNSNGYDNDYKINYINNRMYN